MSLRLRLTLLYSTLTGGILLVFAAAVIMVFNALLVNQIDNTLESAANLIINRIKVNSLGQVSLELSSVDISSDVYVQVWGLDHKLQASLRTLEDFADRPFDRDGLRAEWPIYRDVRLGNQELRVLSVPIMDGDHKIAVLQVAVRMDVINHAREGLTNILTIIWLVSFLFSGNAAWLTLGQTLKPLEAITETAEQINRADDLSRRLPYHGPENDEIGSLVNSFNQTLERLEALFTSQQRLLADLSHELRTPITVIQ